MNESQLPQKLCLRNIYELLGEVFYIPAYQRGYRWGASQVKDLLDDIWEFSQSAGGNDSAFYCLQPVVVIRQNDCWQVVDGQQRLTTLRLILHYMEQEHLRRPLADAYKKSLYTLQYETRPECEAFLQRIHEESNLDNIDFYHMVKAYEAIQTWFAEKDFNDNNKLMAILLAKSAEERAVKVIWYDLSDECVNNDYAIDVFSRINIGKIPLTNAELIKALFLQKNHFHNDQARLKQLQIATEWDAIEKRLQEPALWYFISNSNERYPTRIEYIFDLMKGKKPSDEAFFTFHKFHEDFKTDKIDVEQLWQGIKRYFLTFDEWFQDRELYHLIGYLVDCGKEIATLKQKSEQENSTKTDFKNHLKTQIRGLVNVQLDNLEYGNADIKKLLLLFNIQTLLSTKEADVRFPFDRYKQEKWDIEHIRSQTDSSPAGTARQEWLRDIETYFGKSEAKEGQEFATQASSLLDKERIDESEFKEFYERVIRFFKQGPISWGDQLGNLALLDATTNRSYKNALFPIKRARIIDNDKNGVFIPIGTKNVFLKYYSRQSVIELMHWEESDAKDYQHAIGEMLKDYLPEQEGTSK
ncbi:DUF262 domain-containing protein [Iodobacter fluviatilis]|uniref:Uncharacterized conserved protein n=1 Tax=Iodobacter fluviatilis TaxID=537 RepID=A0A377Q9J2_9NEIS|nr:DUF262 domain-containing protein [Iodobacter fluviatilis]TCU88554.1 uncharacterized protein with ParB-like and HNH nuclease domain [Iodobacter fluviatilis]STQ91375.1 Uncharacterized conserved protein [Iodobacter fluviatilis]